MNIYQNDTQTSREKSQRNDLTKTKQACWKYPNTPQETKPSYLKTKYLHIPFKENRHHTSGSHDQDSHNSEDRHCAHEIKRHKGLLPSEVDNGRPQWHVGGDLEQAAQEHVQVRVGAGTRRDILVYIFSVVYVEINEWEVIYSS